MQPTFELTETRPVPSPPAPWERLRDDAARRLAGPVWILVVELFIGLGWARAATEKLIAPDWWTGDVLRGFAASQRTAALDWYEPFLVRFVEPNAVLVGATVVVLQLIAAAALLAGRQRTLGLGVGIFLNLHFLAAGAVNPSAFYLLSQGTVALALAERSRSDLAGPLHGIGFVAASLAALSLPSVSTLHPARVIEDPAVMLLTGAALCLLACELVLRRQGAPESRAAGE